MFYLHSLGPLLEIVVPEMEDVSFIGIGPLFGVSLEYRIGSVSFEWVLKEDPYLFVADLPQAVADALAATPTYALIELSDLSPQSQPPMLYMKASPQCHLLISTATERHVVAIAT